MALSDVEHGRGSGRRVGPGAAIDARKNRPRDEFRGSTNGELLAWLRTILSNNLVDAFRHYGHAERDAARILSLENEILQSFRWIDALVTRSASSPSQQAIARTAWGIVAMSSSDVSARNSAGELLDQLVADYVRAVESGDPPDREQLLAAHPDLADELRDFFHHRDRMEKLLDPLRSAARRVLNIRCPHCHSAIELVDHAQVTDLSCPSCGSSFSLVATDSKGRFPGGMERIGQFQLVEQVGVGQFGSVWKARDLTLERTVAIKIPRSGRLCEAEAAMFLRDARLSAQLHHPNIVSVHEVGKLHDTLYIVSDFIQGASLKEWNAVKRLSPGEAARLCMKIATALHQAHEAGIVHRDLKPGNVMMDLSGEPHLVDFGLAKRDGGEITMTLEGQILGTPAYMSPEQANGEGHGVDRRADIYSLGVILFELLTGELPFRGEKQMLIAQIRKDDPPSPRKFNVKVPGSLETICLKCLRKEPAKRYQTAAALAEDLQRWLDRKPILARPVGRAEKAWLWCRRRPAISSLLTLLALVIAVAVLVSREVQHRERADGLVNQLMASDFAELPRAIAQLEPYRDRVRFRLSADSTIDVRNPDADRQLRASLASYLLYEDERYLESLYERMLSASPEEFAVLRDALSSRRDDFLERLWSLAETAESDVHGRFRACCALAAYTPHDNRWEGIARLAADQLVSVLPSQLAKWQDQLRPARQQLIGPLRDIFRDASEWPQKRNFAADSLADYLAADPEALFSLLMESGEQQFGILFSALAAHRAQFVRLLQEELQRPRDDSANDGANDQFARRRAYSAVALYELDLPEVAAAVLRHSADPSARTRFIHWAAPLGIDPHKLITQLNQVQEVSTRRALVLALGEFTDRQLTDSERDRLLPPLLALFRNDPDAGLHSAVRWLLQRWGYREQLLDIEKELAAGEQAWQDSQRADGPAWYVNTQGHTMVVVQPATFVMGAPDSAPAHYVSYRGGALDRPRHRVNIGRTFAVATTEVTRKQWKRFLRDQTWRDGLYRPNAYSADDECPQNAVTWYHAAAYCNWLSRQEGIAEDQWYYQPNEKGAYQTGMRPAPGYRARTGYRLPTEAEWEFACRAGAATNFCYGDRFDFLTQYACCRENSFDRTSLVARFKPNDLGLFDMHGNVWEWCEKRGRPYFQYPGDFTFFDPLRGDAVTDQHQKVVRGGDFDMLVGRLDAAEREWEPPTYRALRLGFRIARTIDPGREPLPDHPWIRAQELGRKGQWNEAAELMQQALDDFPDDDAQRWLDVTRVWHYLERVDKVRENCDEMLCRFRATKIPRVAHLVAVANLLAGREITVDVERLIELSLSEGDLSHRGDAALRHLRRNEFAQAVEWFQKKARLTDYGKLKRLYYLAMAQQQLGDEAGSQASLDGADRLRAEIMAGFADGEFGEYWTDWLHVEAVRREAEQVLGMD